MHSLHHVLMKTYLQMKRLVSAQAMPLGLSPGQPKILEFFGGIRRTRTKGHCGVL